MRLPKILLFTLTLCLWSASLPAQERTVPKTLRAKGDYIHTATQTVFPSHFDSMKREGIYAFDRQEENIGVTYQDGRIGSKTTLSIYVYPAGAGREGRLREEYLNAVYAISYGMAQAGRGSDFVFEQHPVRHEGAEYICNGFMAHRDGRVRTLLSLYECGLWFFKVRLTSEVLDSAGMVRLERLAVEQFDPSHLTALAPLRRADVLIAPDAFQDSTMRVSVQVSAYDKLQWAYESVPERERASGFPDIYLDLHIRTWQSFDDAGQWVCEQPECVYQTDFTIRYRQDWRTVVESGYLAEFLMDRYGMVMVVPDGLELDMEGFYRWQEDHPVDIDLNEKLSLIVYQPDDGKE